MSKLDKRLAKLLDQFQIESFAVKEKTGEYMILDDLGEPVVLADHELAELGEAFSAAGMLAPNVALSKPFTFTLPRNPRHCH